MRLGIVGGRLQGTEAAYLGSAAGYEVVVVDREPATPASGLASEYHVFDVVTHHELASQVLGSCDVVVPACENLATLRALADMLPRLGVPFVFHLPSYEITRSKLVSDRLFARLGVPRPLEWPECGFPVVVKPSGASGSIGVSVAEDAAQLAAARARLEAAGHEVVVQRYVQGPSLSLEVMRTADGSIATFLPTLLEFDDDYDCKRVTAPVPKHARVLRTLADVSAQLAEAVGLVGLMDVEVMVDDDVPRVIEIDARLPSQTPTAVYHSSGVNLVAALVGLFREGSLPDTLGTTSRGVCYQHVRGMDGTLTILGEHVMAGAGPLRSERDAFGADVLLTDLGDARSPWVCTLICTDRDVRGARAKADAATRELARHAGLELAGEFRRTASKSFA